MKESEEKGDCGVGSEGKTEKRRVREKEREEVREERIKGMRRT